MLRFSYTDITKKQPTCNNCQNSCKNNVLISGCMNSNVKLIFNPKTTHFPGDDYRQLLKQVMISKLQARSTISMHCRNSFITPSDHPTIDECQIFIGAMDVFREYLLEYKDIHKRNPALAIRTVIVVKEDKIISLSEISELNKRLKYYAQQTGNKFTTDEPVF
jgi:hypothetical protein